MRNAMFSLLFVCHLYLTSPCAKCGEEIPEVCRRYHLACRPKCNEACHSCHQGFKPAFAIIAPLPLHHFRLEQHFPARRLQFVPICNWQTVLVRWFFPSLTLSPLSQLYSFGILCQVAVQKSKTQDASSQCDDELIHHEL